MVFGNSNAKAGDARFVASRIRVREPPPNARTHENNWAAGLQAPEPNPQTLKPAKLQTLNPLSGNN
jgi:hypothetical protein